MQLRPYQQRVYNQIHAGWNINEPTESLHRAVMAVMPTGAGKTVLFNKIASEFIARGQVVLIVAHREELILQAHDKFTKMVPGHVLSDIIMGSYTRAHSSRLKIGSIQTIGRRIKPDGSHKLGIVPAPSLVIIDEAHHAAGAQYQKLIDLYSNSLLLMVTATPERLDGSGFKEFCDEMVIGPTVADLEQLWREAPQKNTGLVPDRILNIQLSNKLRSVKKRAGDFDAKEVNKIINTDAACRAIVECWLEHANGKQTIAFCSKKSKEADVGHNDRLAATFREYGVAAACIKGDTPKEQRRALLEQFANKQIQVLTNVEIFTEGFDCPGVDCTILARPTLSLSLYLQMAGRGKRPDGIGKLEHLMLDFVGNAIAHGEPNDPREWGLGGKIRKPRDVNNIQVKWGEQVMMFNELPETDEYGGTVYYEILGEVQPMRTAQFDRSIGADRLPLYERKKRGPAAIKKFLKKVAGRPNLDELKHVAKSLGYKEGWAWVNYKKFTEIAAIYDSIKDPGDIVKMHNYLERNLRFPARDGQKLGMPGYGYTYWKEKMNEKLMNMAMA